jgi:hypothetical protein
MCHLKLQVRAHPFALEGSIDRRAGRAAHLDSGKALEHGPLVSPGRASNFSDQLLTVDHAPKMSANAWNV